MKKREKIAEILLWQHVGYLEGQGSSTPLRMWMNYATPRCAQLANRLDLVGPINAVVGHSERSCQVPMTCC
jgi:hypothetical protein